MAGVAVAQDITAAVQDMVVAVQDTFSLFYPHATLPDSTGGCFRPADRLRRHFRTAQS